jgi:hypothetical protein
MNRPTGSATGELVVQIKTLSAALEGGLSIPKGAQGVVLFAHGAEAAVQPATAMAQVCRTRGSVPYS